MSEKPVREYDKFMLRFPDGMRDAIAERAKENGRSMNSEIVQMLQDGLEGKTSTEQSASLSLLAELIREQREIIINLERIIAQNQ